MFACLLSFLPTIRTSYMDKSAFSVGVPRTRQAPPLPSYHCLSAPERTSFPLGCFICFDGNYSPNYPASCRTTFHARFALACWLPTAHGLGCTQSIFDAVQQFSNTSFRAPSYRSSIILILVAFVSDTRLPVLRPRLGHRTIKAFPQRDFV